MYHEISAGGVKNCVDCDKVCFWSDGSPKEFRSQYTFRMIALFPKDLSISWDYGEAHHFKGKTIISEAH